MNTAKGNELAPTIMRLVQGSLLVGHGAQKRLAGRHSSVTMRPSRTPASGSSGFTSGGPRRAAPSIGCLYVAGVISGLAYP